MEQHWGWGRRLQSIPLLLKPKAQIFFCGCMCLRKQRLSVFGEEPTWSEHATILRWESLGSRLHLACLTSWVTQTKWFDLSGPQFSRLITKERNWTRSAHRQTFYNVKISHEYTNTVIPSPGCPEKSPGKLKKKKTTLMPGFYPRILI